MPEYLFIYDHNLLDGKEDSNYDPADAILYFYPTSTSVDYQHSLCSHVMGFCQILSNILKSPPKSFTLESGARIACVHEPYFGLIQKSRSQVLTFALYSDSSSSTHLHEKCVLIYESFIFYMKKCLACVFKKGKSKSNYLGNVVERLMNLINHRDKLSLIFNASLYCDHDRKGSTPIDSFLYQTMINTVDSMCNQSETMDVSILGSCFFYKRNLILNQFSVNVSNLFSLLIDCINSDTDKTGKEIFGLIKRIQIDTNELHARDGVFLFQVCVTNKRYQELISTAQSTSKLDKKNCCDNVDFQYIHLYLEHHSNTTIITLIDEPDLQKINKELLKTFGNLCFNVLGVIEAHMATTKTKLEDRSDRLMSSSVNLWNITYDEIDHSISKTNSINGTNIPADWEEWLIKRADVLHSNMEKEETIKEIHIKVKKETLSTVRFGNQQIYTMKSTN